MNVAIVLMRYNPFGGYERQAALLAKELSRRGDRVTVFANAWEAEEGITFEKVPVIGISSWLKVLSFAIYSRRRILEGKKAFDVVVAFDRTLLMDIYRAGNACHREWQAFRKKYGGTRDAFSMALNPLHRVINSVERRIFSRIQEEGGRVVVLSEAGMEQILRNYPVSRERFTVIPPAVDLGRFDEGVLSDREGARKSLGLPERALTLLHVGSGFRIKGLSSTIRALRELASEGIEATLLVAGSDRRETGRLKRLSEGLGVAGRVRFLGGVRDLAPLYAASDVFVLPSLFETFSASAVEALYAGLPVVIGSGAGASGIIEEWGAGRVVEVPADPATLATVIKDVLSAEEKLKSAGSLDAERLRRKQIAMRYATEAVMERFLALIDQVAVEKRSGASAAKPGNNRYAPA